MLRRNFELLKATRSSFNAEHYKLILNTSCWDIFLEVQLFNAIMQKRHLGYVRFDFGFFFPSHYIAKWLSH